MTLGLQCLLFLHHPSITATQIAKSAAYNTHTSQMTQVHHGRQFLERRCLIPTIITLLFKISCPFAVQPIELQWPHSYPAVPFFDGGCGGKKDRPWPCALGCIHGLRTCLHEAHARGHRLWDLCSLQHVGCCPTMRQCQNRAALGLHAAQMGSLFSWHGQRMHGHPSGWLCGQAGPAAPHTRPLSHVRVMTRQNGSGLNNWRVTNHIRSAGSSKSIQKIKNRFEFKSW